VLEARRISSFALHFKLLARKFLLSIWHNRNHMSNNLFTKE
jgi:hypothetical protein